MRIFLILLLLPLKMFSQSIEGVWTGTLYNDTTKKNHSYEIAITENLARNKGKEILKNNEYEQKSVHFIINSNVITVNETGE